MPDPRPRIVALDVAQTTAASWREIDGSVATDVRFLGRRGDAEGQSRRLREFLGDVALLVDPTLVVLERDARRGVGYAANERLRAEVLAFFRRLGIPVRNACPAAAYHRVCGGLLGPRSVVRALDETGLSRAVRRDEIDAAVLLVDAERAEARA